MHAIYKFLQKKQFFFTIYLFYVIRLNIFVITKNTTSIKTLNYE